MILILVEGVQILMTGLIIGGAGPSNNICDVSPWETIEVICLSIIALSGELIFSSSMALFELSGSEASVQYQESYSAHYFFSRALGASIIPTFDHAIRYILTLDSKISAKRTSAEP